MSSDTGPDAGTVEAGPGERCTALLAEMRTLQLSTVGDDGTPHCGYTPYLHEAPCSLYVFVSQLSAHTRDIKANGRAAVMIIEDESRCSQMFARTRVSYQCLCHSVAATHSEYERILDAFQHRHGKMVGLLRQLPDFQLFLLKPVSGQFVMGFGKAYRVHGEHLDEFEHTRIG